MSWVAAAIAGISVGKGVYGAVSANQTKQRNKGTIDDAYRTASARMSQQQAYGAEGNDESLNARGLGTTTGPGASPIRAAMLNGTSAATNLGEQSQANLQREYGLDRHSLDTEHTQALNENSATALNAEIGSVASGVQGVIGAYGAKQDAGMYQGASGSDGSLVNNIAREDVPGVQVTGSGSPSTDMKPIRTAMGFGGADVIDPLGHPDSSWNPNRRTVSGAGLGNSDFNTGLG